MKLTDCNDTLENIGVCGGVGLMKHTLVAVADGSRLVCIDSGDNDYLVRYLIGYLFKSCDVVEHGGFAVCRAGSDYEKELVAFAGENSLYFLVSLLLDLYKLLRNGVHLLDFLRNR